MRFIDQIRHLSPTHNKSIQAKGRGEAASERA